MFTYFYIFIVCGILESERNIQFRDISPPLIKTDIGRNFNWRSNHTARSEYPCLVTTCRMERLIVSFWVYYGLLIVGPSARPEHNNVKTTKCRLLMMWPRYSIWHTHVPIVPISAAAVFPADIYKYICIFRCLLPSPVHGMFCCK